MATLDRSLLATLHVLLGLHDFIDAAGDRHFARALEILRSASPSRCTFDSVFFPLV
jgi:hypothetical protein